MARGNKRTQRQETDEELKEILDRAETTLRPSANAAAVIAEFGKPFGEQDIGGLMAQLTIGTRALKENDLTQCESMLFDQAHALQSIFMNFARRAASQEYLKQMETYMRLGLKAQSQCVRTLEVLATIKNPQPVAFVKQANIAHGPQQVNNGTAPPAGPAQPQAGTDSTEAGQSQPESEKLYLSPSARGENEIAPNELLSQPVHSPVG